VQEKRKLPRVKDKLVVVCETPKGGNVEQIEHTQDLSEGGLKISIPKTAVLGDQLTIKIKLFNDEIPIAAKGKIAWKKDKQTPAQIALIGEDVAGLEFIGLDPKEEARIKRYLKRKLRGNK